jgi:TP901 family phage tail tape measure protein
MANDITQKVVLQLVDQMSGKVKAAVDASKPALEQFGAQAEKLGRSLESIGTRFAAVGGAVQLGLSRFNLDINSVATASVAAEKALYSIASTAGKSGTDAREAVASWGQTINQLAVASNQAQAEVISAFQDLVSKGISDADALRMLEPIGRAATAAGANIRDIASAANASFQNLGIQPERLAKALDMMAQAGKAGAFELKDMAQYFDALTVKSALLGSKGEAALGQLAAAAQIARKGAGDASTAANNLANFLDKLSAPVTANAFEKFGVNLADEVKKGLASGDLIGYMGQLIQNITQGDASKVSALFADVQAKNFIAPLIQNLEEYKRIRDDALGASGTVARDFDTQMQSMSSTFDRLKIAGQAALGSSEVIKKLLEGLTSLADWAAAHPDAVAILGIGSAAVLAGGALVAGIGAIITAIGSMATAAAALGAVLAANPAVLAILGVAVAGYAGFKFGGFIKEQIDIAVQAMTGSGSLGVAIYDMVQALKKLPKQFMEIGAQIVQGLIDGIKNKARELYDAAVGLATSLPAWVKKALDIKSPSKVMQDIGEQAAAGYVIGLQSGVQSVGEVAAQLAAATTTNAAGSPNNVGSPTDQASVMAEREAAEISHQQRLFDIRNFYNGQTAANAARYNQLNLQSASVFFQNMGALMQTKSRALFEIGKAGAIGETIIQTYAGAQKAFSALAGIPIIGPALGTAAAAAAILAGGARVAAISSTSFGSTSASPVLSSGGVSGPVTSGGAGVVPFDSPTSALKAAAPERVVNIYLTGEGSPTQSYIRDVLVPGLNEALGDGVTLNVRAA